MMCTVVRVAACGGLSAGTVLTKCYGSVVGVSSRYGAAVYVVRLVDALIVVLAADLTAILTGVYGDVVVASGNRGAGGVRSGVWCGGISVRSVLNLLSLVV